MRVCERRASSHGTSWTGKVQLPPWSQLEASLVGDWNGNGPPIKSRDWFLARNEEDPGKIPFGTGGPRWYKIGDS